MKIPFFNKPPLIGLDIQPDAARLIQLRKIRKGYQLERVAMMPLPSDLLIHGKVQAWDGLTTILAEWFEALGIKRQIIAISLPMSAVRVQRFSLPASLSEAEIEAEIFTHLQHKIPGLSEPLCIDFSVLPPQQAGCIEVLFAATRERYLMQLVDCIQAAGVRVKIVDVDMYALARAIHASLVNGAVLHVKSTVTELIVFQHDEIIFHCQWETSFLKEWWQKLKDSIKQLPEKITVQQLLVCGGAEQIDFQVLTELMNCSVLPIRISSQFNAVAHNDMTMLITQEADFNVACGLAMRDAPSW